MLAAAASVVLIGTAAGWWLARTGDATAAKATVASLHTNDGVNVGEVVASDRPQPWMAVSVDLTTSHAALPASGHFTVALTYRDGRRVPLGAITLVDGRGTLGARTNVAVSHLAGVAVVGPGGADLCAGFLGPHPPGAHPYPPGAGPHPPPGSQPR
jgi:hypothetical protein